MLHVPFKKPDNTDVVGPLNHFFDKQFTKEEAIEYKKNVNLFQTIRNNAVSVNGNSGQLGCHHLLRYSYHMNIACKRLGGYEREINFSFNWLDAFQPGKKVRSASLYHDWACNLWNFAALSSFRGTLEDRNTDEGVRNAALFFMQAAGAFSVLKADIVPKIQGPKSQEFNTNFLNLLIDLHLAQSQICFYEKAVRGKKAGSMKSGIVAMLAKQVAIYFEQAGGFARDKEVMRSIDASWSNHMDLQRECFHGAAEYWQAQSAKEAALSRGTGYGEEISRLSCAEEYFQRAVGLGKSKRLHGPSLAMAESFLESVRRMKTTAVSDNQTIYHDRVPESRALSEILPHSMVKVAPLPTYPTNPNVAAERELFSDVLPKEVRNLLSLYQHRLADLISRTEQAAVSATNSGRASLSANGLPGALEAYKSGGKFPSGLWKKVENVQVRGGGASVLSTDVNFKVEDMQRSAQRAKETVSNIEYSMKREDNIDNSFRQRYPQYKLPRSSELNQDTRHHVHLLSQALENAQNEDQALLSRIQSIEFQDSLKLLSMNHEELESQLPQGGSGASGTVDTSDLEGCLVHILELFEKREQAISDMKAHCNDFDAQVTEALCDATFGKPPLSNEATESLLDFQLAALEPLTKAVIETFSDQERLMQDILKANEAFNAARVTDPLQKERDSFIKKVEQGVNDYSQVVRHISAASTFYMDIQSRLNSYMQQTDDFSYTQQLQRQDFEVVSMREQDRESQLESDHDMALRLARDQNPPEEAQRQFHQLQLSGQDNKTYGYPQLPQNLSQPTLRPQQQQPIMRSNDMEIAYGQPLSGPPIGATQYPPQPPQPQEQKGESISHPNAFNNQMPASQNVANNPHSSYVYNAGFGGGNTDGNVSNILQGQQGRAVQYSSGFQQGMQPTQSGPVQYQHQTNQQNRFQGQSQVSASVDESKVCRLVEMGFPREAVVAYLAANGNNEEAALNGLLSGPSTY